MQIWFFEVASQHFNSYVFQISQDSYRTVGNDLKDGFIIDTTLGRDVKFTIDQSGVPGSNNVINVIEILYPNGTDLFYTIGDVAQSFSKTFDFLEVTNCLFIYFVLNMYVFKSA